MKMLGSDAILRSLEAEGVEVCFGIPGGAILPALRRVRARHDRAPRARPPRAGRRVTWRRATRAPRARVGVAIATSGPGATNLVTPIADAWMDSTPLVCVTGQVRRSLIGTDAFQECDITGDHDPDRQALVARPGRGGDPARHEGGFPHRAHGPLRPRARRRAARRAGGGDRLRVPRRRSICPAGSRRSRGHATPDQGGRERGSRPRSGRSSTSAAARQRRRLRRAAGARRARAAPRRDDPDGQGRVSRRRTSCSSAGPGCTARSGRTGRSTRPT